MSGLTKTNSRFIAAFYAMLAFTFFHVSPVHAQVAAGSIGDLILNLEWQLFSFPRLMTAVSYLLGLGFGVWGIVQFVNHADSPSQIPINNPIRMLIACAFFLGAPTLVSHLMFTFGFNWAADLTTYGLGDTPTGQVGTPDYMLSAFAYDLWEPMLILLNAFCYIAGIFFLLKAIYRITKGFNEGATGPLGMGTFTHFLVAALLMSAPQAIGALSLSIFGSSDVATYAVISSGVIDDPELKARAEAIMMSVQTFMVLIGIISFLRGWFILKSVSDGNSQATSMAAFSHIIAGVVAVNIGPFVNAVQLTFGLNPANGLMFN